MSRHVFGSVQFGQACPRVDSQPCAFTAEKDPGGWVKSPLQMLCAELCPLQIYPLKPYPLVPQNVTAFEDGAFKMVIKLKQGCQGGP